MEGNHYLLACRIVRYIAATFLIVACVGPEAGAQETPDEPEHQRVMGADSCLKCHGSEVQTWRATPHAQTINTLHRTPAAKEIASRLGLRSVKRNETCVRCHYTQREVRGRARIDSGVSCESCHGPARDWIEVHAEYGPGVTRQTETPEQRRKRRQLSIAAGMNNPSNLYLIARQCLDCHTTPDESLVDVGGHPAGSRDFELVSWSQGKVRHNFVRSDGAFNEPSPPERLRVMYVVGVMTDLEYSLRAVAKASQAGVFATASAERAAAKKQELWELQRRLENPLIADALKPLSDLQLKLGNSEAIRQAADTLSDAAFALAEKSDGAQMAVIDDLLPPPESYR